MDEIDSTDSLQAASIRIDKALEQLEKNIISFDEQGKVISNLQTELDNLKQKKTELKTKFEHSSRKEKNLDKAASEVSLQLIDAIKTIKSVLVK